MSASSSKKTSMMDRSFRFVFSVVVLSALVLGVTLGVREVSTADPVQIAYKLKPLLAQLHIQVDEKQIGDVAGKFVERISQTNLGSGVTTSRLDTNSASSDVSGVTQSKSKELFKVAILSDIHQDLPNLEKALVLVKSSGVNTVFLLGDLTNFGDIATLSKVKDVLDKSGLTYFALPGDHDIAQSVSAKNFVNVFGKDYFSTTIQGYKFVALDNSFNYTPVTPIQVTWFDENARNASFILLSQPLYTTGLSALFEKIYMGSSVTDPQTQDLVTKQEAVRDQGTLILNMIRGDTVIKAVIAGEHHKSSQVIDSQRKNLMHFVVGAVSDSVNDYPQNLIQTPRFSIMTVFEDGTYKVEDVTL